jgi:hypothetical protein
MISPESPPGILASGTRGIVSVVRVLDPVPVKNVICHGEDAATTCSDRTHVLEMRTALAT